MRGLYLARDAMLVQQARLDVISNNLANQGTVGFKRDETVQQSFAEQLIWQINGNQSGGLPGPAGRRPVGEAVHSTVIGGIMTDFTGGPLLETGRGLDFALIGDGFFRVQADGGFLYTRNGRFFLDEAGYLVTGEGYDVWGEAGPILVDAEELHLSGDGEIYAGGAFRGRLELFSFAPETALEKVGGGYYRAAGEAEVSEARVWGGFLEGSNVDLTREMVKLMEVRRSYEAAQKIMSVNDNLLQKAASDLGSLR